MCIIIKVSIHMRKTERSQSGRLRQLKNKRKVQLGNPKSGCVRLRELFITKFKSHFKRGFTKVIVTRAGRLREWSPEELRPYNCTHKRHRISLVQRRPNIRSHSVLLNIFSKRLLLKKVKVDWWGNSRRNFNTSS